MTQITKEEDGIKLLLPESDNGTTEVVETVKEGEDDSGRSCRLKSAFCWKHARHPERDRQVAFWDKRATKYDEGIRNHDSDYRRTVRSAKARLTRSDVVLDFGCASGEFSLAIADSVQRAHGIDTSSNMIALATGKTRDRSAANLTFDTTDLFDLPLDTHHYTAILAFNVFHLVEDVSAVLGRINRLLPAGGLLFSQTPCLGERGFLFKLFVRFAQKLRIAPPIRGLTYTKLESLISSSGFEILESEIWDEKDAVRRVVARKPD